MSLKLIIDDSPPVELDEESYDLDSIQQTLNIALETECEVTLLLTGGRPLRITPHLFNTIQVLDD